MLGSVIITSLASWHYGRVEESWVWIQRCLLQSFNQSAGSPLKKLDLSVTPDGFFRLRKYFPTGKQEYFSFRFTRLSEIEYEGSVASGNIVFKTLSDDIIVQTYNDPRGNIDSMSAFLAVPVVNMEPERVDSLRNALLMFKH